ncbi:MAG: Gfo/Idh/MocA family oxidoreductase [Agathobacter sp.]|nr:Gfo/Idh/MocA family oxidoreductase [Agathobacter sp.]
MKEIRLGTIGSGFIVHNILDAVEQVEGIRCVAVYSRTEEKGKALADKYQVEKIYTDMRTFLADENINCVYVASPNLLHYEQTKMALLAGKHVLCEKPFCTKLEHAKELVSIAKEKGLFLMEAVPTTYLPNYEVLKKSLEKIGPIKLVQGNFSQYSSRYDAFLRGELPNVFNPAFAGGCLMDINFYNVYLNVALFGKAKSTNYFPNIAKQAHIDTSGVLLMQYEEFVSTNTGAKDTWGENFFLIEGEKGYLYAEGGSCSLRNLRIVTKESEEIIWGQADDERWNYEIKKLTKLLLADKFDEIYEKLNITLDTVEIIEDARKKADIRFPGDE